MAIEEHDFPPPLDTFAARLTFVRVFVARYKHSDEMARRLGFAASTYATWEDGKKPRDKVAVAERVSEEFPSVQPDWLLRGGRDGLFTYPSSDYLLGTDVDRDLILEHRMAVAV